MAWECKLDGWRALVYIDDRLRVRTRQARARSASRYPSSSDWSRLDGRTAILDGELIACPAGVVDFYALAPRMSHRPHGEPAAAQIPVTFVAFDFLHLDGQDLTGRPLARDRLVVTAELEATIPNREPGCVSGCSSWH